MSVIQGNINETLQNFLSQTSYTKIAVVSDSNTHKYCYPIIKNLIPKHILIKLSPGEDYKNLDSCQTIWNKLTEKQFDRHSLVINLGGGVIGDMGGFAASTYKRGVDFIQIPTTLLAQVDASVGGKLGIDFNGFKNHIGVFKIPKTVLIDPVFLKTLTYKERRSGFAEIVKHCLIRDKNKWEEIKTLDFEEMPINDLIKHSVAIKSQIVADDPEEKGLRKILNFGHTIGHAIETYFLNKGTKILHGEAVAAGMICESFVAHQKNMLSLEELIEIEEFIFSIFGVVKIKADDIDSITLLINQDKKNKGNQVLASLLNGIGNCQYNIQINQKDTKKALKYYSGI